MIIFDVVAARHPYERPRRNRSKRITRHGHDAPHNIWPQSRHEEYVSARRHRHTDGYVSWSSNIRTSRLEYFTNLEKLLPRSQFLRFPIVSRFFKNPFSKRTSKFGEIRFFFVN